VRLAVLVILVVLWSGGPGSTAAIAAEEGWGYELANELMSPFCPGRALAECPSPNAVKLRAWIIDQDKAGVPRADVEAELYTKWGDSLRQTPRAEGVGLVAYAIPVIVVFSGAGLLALFLGRRRVEPVAAPPADPSETPSTADAELEAALERELAQAPADRW